MESFINPPAEQEAAEKDAALLPIRLAENDTSRPDPLEGKPIEYDATGRMIKPEENSQHQMPPVPARKPENINKFKDIERTLLDFIGELESSDNYNIIARGDKKPLTKMTVKEVRQFQQNLEDQGTSSTALGRYQIKDDTLDYLIKRMKLDGNEIFDETIQDAMAASATIKPLLIIGL